MKRRLSSLAAALVLLCAPPARAATNIVTTLADSGPGSLRSALADALPGDAITFATNGTLTLTSGELVITKDLSICGPGRTNLAISGNGSSRVFRIDGVTVRLADLTVKEGRTRSGTNGYFFSPPPYNNGEPSSPGGGIFNSGSLSLLNCALIGNATGYGGYGVYAFPFGSTGGGGTSGHGGAIYSTGALTLTNCLLTSNAIGVGGPGGDNGTSYGLGANAGNGGAIYCTGIMVLEECVFVGNQTGFGGGGSGGGRGGSGGGIYCTMPIVLNNCVFDSNAAAGGGSSADGGFAGEGGHGGAVYISGGGNVIQNCHFLGNNAGSGGRAGYFAIPGSGGKGGAVFNGGAMILSHATVSGNGAGAGGMVVQQTFPSPSGSAGDGGGIYNAGSLTMTNCTISGNSTRLGGEQPNYNNGLMGNGGGICSSGFLSVNSCTIVSNRLGSAPYVYIYRAPPGLGGGIYSTTNSQLVNTLVAGNYCAYMSNINNVRFDDDVFGPFSSQSHNLISVTNRSTGFAVPNDLVGSLAAPLNARLGPLANNGGASFTHALLPDSPALDAGDDAVATFLATDQRGSPRHSGLHVDIGAFEVLQPQLTGAAWSNGTFGFVLHGAAGSNYVLQVSSNLVTWQPFLTNTIPGDGRIPISNSSITNLPRQFYRAVPE